MSPPVRLTDCRSSRPGRTANCPYPQGAGGRPVHARVVGRGGARGRPGLDLENRRREQRGLAVRQCRLRGAEKFRPRARGPRVRSAIASLFAADRETGLIHRFGPDGAERGRYDHGVTGREAMAMTPVPFDPSRTLDIANPPFDAPTRRPGDFALPKPLVFGLAVHAAAAFLFGRRQSADLVGRPYARGRLHGDPRSEFVVPIAVRPSEISKIAFDDQGRILLAERPVPTGAYDFAELSRAGVGRVLALCDRCEPPVGRRNGGRCPTTTPSAFPRQCATPMAAWPSPSLRRPGPHRPRHLRWLSVVDRRGVARGRDPALAAQLRIGAPNMSTACRATNAGPSAPPTSRRCTSTSPIAMTTSTISPRAAISATRDLSAPADWRKAGARTSGAKAAAARRLCSASRPADPRDRQSRRRRANARCSALVRRRRLPAARRPQSDAAVPARRAARTRWPMPADSLSRAQRAGGRQLLQAGHPGDGGLLLLLRRPGFGGAEPFLLPVVASLFWRQRRQRLLSGTSRQWPVPAGNAGHPWRSAMPAGPDAARCAAGYVKTGNICCLAGQATANGTCCPVGEIPVGDQCQPIHFTPPGPACCAGGQTQTLNGQCCATANITTQGVCCPTPSIRKSPAVSGPDPGIVACQPATRACPTRAVASRACLARRQKLRENCAARAGPAAAPIETAADRLFGSARAAFHSRPQTSLRLRALWTRHDRQ